MKYQLPILSKWWQISNSISEKNIIAPFKEKCNDGKIIEASQICDGIFDCLDFGDEINCEKCPEQVSKLCFYRHELKVKRPFKCEYESKCISKEAVCDRKNDCFFNNDEQNCNRDSFLVLNGENYTVDDFLLPAELLQVQVLEDFKTDFIQWERGDFGLLTISNLNRRIYGRKINTKADEFTNGKNIVRIPHILKSKLSGKDFRLSDICNPDSRIRLNFNPPVGSFYCERLSKDLKNMSPEYRKHVQCRAILDFLDGQALCDGYQVRMMKHSKGLPATKPSLIIP